MFKVSQNHLTFLEVLAINAISPRYTSIVEYDVESFFKYVFCEYLAINLLKHRLFFALCGKKAKKKWYKFMIMWQTNITSDSISNLKMK